MFYEPIAHPEKRASAEQTLQLINELCVELAEKVHPLSLAFGVVLVSCHFGWTTRELMVEFQRQVHGDKNVASW